MPTYVYACPKCKAEIELVQRQPDEPMCCSDDCNGSIRMEQVIVTTSFVLKGKRWARDGYSG